MEENPIYWIANMVQQSGKCSTHAFVPSDDVGVLFEQLLQSLNTETDAILEEFLSYFESTWVGIMQRGRRRRPLFDRLLWSCYYRVLDDLPKTNNSLEGWHHAFNR